MTKRTFSALAGAALLATAACIAAPVGAQDQTAVPPAERDGMSGNAAGDSPMGAQDAVQLARVDAASVTAAAATQVYPEPQTNLPEPTSDPLTIEIERDPLLSLTKTSASPGEFRETVQKAVALHPALDEASSYAQQARFGLYETRAVTHPSAELSISGFQVIDRDFSGGGLDNIVERTRASRRFDQYASINQLVTDFGASSQRIKAAGDTLRAASLSVDDTAARVALRTIAAWYDVYILRTVLAISQSYRRDQEASKAAISDRVREGASAEVDAALVDNSLAQLDIRIARFRQELSTAETRFRELTGVLPPADLGRAPALGAIPETIEDARRGSLLTPASRAAEFEAQAASHQAKAARRDLLPVVTTSLNAGRYGLLEESRDYDVTAQLSLRMRLFGGLPQRARALEAGAVASDARATRIREENARDAALAFSELESLETQMLALEKAYLATRQTRDAVFERFRFSRGTLFETIQASDSFYSAATGYLQTLAQRDAARYVLLARTGALLDVLRIDPYSPMPDTDQE